MIKKYTIKVFYDTDDSSFLVAEIEAGWVPDDPDRFAWNLGGNRIEIIEEI